VDASRVKAIQLRVCVVLKYWVENQFFDFDEELIQHIFDFVGGTLEQNSPDLAVMVAKELQNRVRACPAHAGHSDAQHTSTDGPMPRYRYWSEKPR
jgi:hypothetical protein